MVIAYTSHQLRQLCRRATKSPLMRVSREVYCNLRQLDICYATPTHRGTTGGQCRLRTPEPIPYIVTTTRNFVVKQTGVDNANLITLTFTESRNGSTTTKQTNKGNLLTLVNVAKLNVHCINVRSVKNKAISVSYLVISRDIDILALTETWLGSAIDAHVINTLVPCGYEFSVTTTWNTRRRCRSAAQIRPGCKTDTYA